MLDSLFSNSNIDSVSSNRIIYTPSTFARSSLIHLQETGTLQATHPHKNERSGLSSCLFFTVLRGSGQLTYDGETYALHSGNCVFIDCKKPYSHETGSNTSADTENEELWSLYSASENGHVVQGNRAVCPLKIGHANRGLSTVFGHFIHNKRAQQ